ncbi:hypothetical protein B0T14DRAFT_419179, partial [Immersiella caudata]
VLKGNLSLRSTPVCRRMSRAAGRQTARPENKAYSLLGVFDVNIPLIYGEGSKGSSRLQEETIAASTT